MSPSTTIDVQFKPRVIILEEPLSARGELDHLISNEVELELAIQRTIGQILNLDTRAITPQYHVIYDEQFTTVGGRLDDPLTATESNASYDFKEHELRHNQ